MKSRRRRNKRGTRQKGYRGGNPMDKMEIDKIKMESQNEPPKPPRM